jgi:bifunctional non-homologous end joining protein LigD
MTDTEPGSLAEYKSKRHFDRTAEPSGEQTTRDPSGPTGPSDSDVGPGETAPGEPDAPARPVFVVQKHNASRLHYDFRLELEGVLKSWAVPKGPSLDPAEKRLAVMVEDHPLEYAAFEGSIPEGEYGGGTVMLWDRGWWEPDPVWMKEAKGADKKGPISSPVEALAKGELKFVVHGEKLAGSWALVKTRWQGENNWLLIKHRDEAARPGSKIVEEAPDSVLTGRSLEEIAAASSAPWGVADRDSAVAAEHSMPEGQTEPYMPPQGEEAR